MVAKSAPNSIRKAGKAKTLTNKEFQYLLNIIKNKRHPEKNTLIMQLSFKLGLRVQEIALLRLHEVVRLSNDLSGSIRLFEVKPVLILPKSFTKGANALRKSTRVYERKSIRFSIDDFDRTVEIIAELAKNGKPVKPEMFYPNVLKNEGVTRELPITDKELIKSIEDYVSIRVGDGVHIKKEDPLILNQKGNSYTPNSLQDHMGLMLKKWGGIERASSHSGRRTLATNMLNKNNDSLAAVQKILGHRSASSTIIYHEVSEEEVAELLESAGKEYSEYVEQ